MPGEEAGTDHPSQAEARTQPEVRVRGHSEVKIGVSLHLGLVLRHQDERLCQAVARVRSLMPELGVGLRPGLESV